MQRLMLLDGNGLIYRGYFALPPLTTSRGELVNAVFEEPTRQMFYRQIRALAEEGCDAAVLGCTEIPLIVRPEESPLPTLDSTRLLAKAALQRALELGAASS